ncbi:MAG: thioredoxin fold domain-containing protein [Chromatiales bacterium]|nr:thioredoxin fold domain-containing protein [Chromatiales bacterium]
MRGVKSYLTLSVITLLSFIIHQAVAETIRIPVAKDLYADSQTARENRQPMVLLVSQEHCPFCVRIKQDVLHPIIKADDYQGQILMRELFIDLDHTVTGFQGGSHSSAAIARSYGVDLTPTLLFLGPDGEELAERIIGYYTPEMFFFYVDQAIRESIDQLESVN